MARLGMVPVQQIPLPLPVHACIPAADTAPLPFSAMRADSGPWQNRKRAWQELGLAGGKGREQTTLFRPTGPLAAKMEGENLGTVSVFDPVLAELSYRWFCPPGGSVLDPFAGGAVRGLVAGSLGLQYTGVDLSYRQVAANCHQAHDWTHRGLLSGGTDWIHGDAATVVPELPGGYDFVFTCPPYHNLERYSDHPADLSAMRWRDFERAYRSIIASTVDKLVDNRFCTWVVSEVRDFDGILRGLVPLTIDAHRAAGAKLYNDAVLLNVIGSAAMRLRAQWNAGRKMGRHHQYVLTFVKGDPKAATLNMKVKASLTSSA